MKIVTEWLLRGIWWFDALVVFGIVFCLLLAFGIPVWMLMSKLRWRRRDQRDVDEYLERIKAAKGTAEVKS